MIVKEHTHNGISGHLFNNKVCSMFSLKKLTPLLSEVDKFLSILLMGSRLQTNQDKNYVNVNR